MHRFCPVKVVSVFIHWTSLRTAKLRMLTNVDTYIFWPLNILYTLTRLSFTVNHNSSHFLIYSPRGPRKLTDGEQYHYFHICYALEFTPSAPAGYVQSNDRFSCILFFAPSHFRNVCYFSFLTRRYLMLVEYIWRLNYEVTCVFLFCLIPIVHFPKKA